MTGFLKGLAWVLWWFLTRAAGVACMVLAVHYGARGGLIPAVAWILLASVVAVVVVFVEDE